MFSKLLHREPKTGAKVHVEFVGRCSQQLLLTSCQKCYCSAQCITSAVQNLSICLLDTIWQTSGLFAKQSTCSYSIIWSRLLSTEYSVLSTQYTVLSTQYSVLSTQYLVLSTQYTVLSTQYSVLSTQYSVLSTQYSVLSTQY